MTTRPEPTEYAPYYERYVSLVPAGDIVATLEQQLAPTLALLRSLSEEQGNHRYAPGKWSIKELVAHLSDTERIMSYRALRFARADQNKLPGFEQDDYIANSNFDAQRLSDLTDEFAAVRQATLYLFKQLEDAAWLRRGIASENEVSVRALAYIIAGHERYHLDVLKSRYL